MEETKYFRYRSNMTTPKRSKQRHSFFTATRRRACKHRCVVLPLLVALLLCICIQAVAVVDATYTNNNNNVKHNQAGNNCAEQTEANNCASSSGQQQQHDDGTTGTQTQREPAECLFGDKRTLIEGPDSPFEVKEWTTHDGTTRQSYRVLVPQKQLLYVPRFLNETQVQELKNFGISQDRFMASPQRNAKLNSNNNGEDDDSDSSASAHQSSTTSSVIQSDKHRTSESCPMVPAATYLNHARFQTMLENRDAIPQTMAALVREVEVTWDISQKAVSLVQSLQLQQQQSQSQQDYFEAEPLQMVRYLHPDAQYTLHHDHGGFYGNTSMEQRPYTILVFLNDVPWEAGGMTSFPKLMTPNGVLGLKVSPRKGDAIVWSNVVVVDDDDGVSNNENGSSVLSAAKADPDMVHAGEPPSIEGVEKYALNIWIQQKALATDQDSIAGGAWGTSK
jgi:hypothetical protein